RASALSSLPRRPPRSPLLPYTTLFRSDACLRLLGDLSMRLHQRLNEVENLSLQNAVHRVARYLLKRLPPGGGDDTVLQLDAPKQDRKSTRLNSSHVKTSYAVFCLNKQR